MSCRLPLFINGIESEKQTAGVKSTLANAFKKISSQKIFMVLSADEVPLDINNSINKAVIFIVNNPQYESAYSPIIAAIIPTKSISKGTGISWDARITKGEKEIPKRRAEIFFKLKQGEFIVFADGVDKKINLKLQI